MSRVYQFVHVGKFLGVFQIHKSFAMRPVPIWVCFWIYPSTQDASHHMDYDLFNWGKAFICHDCTYWVGIRSKACPNFVRLDAPQMCQSALGRQEAQQHLEVKDESQVSQHT